MEATRSISELMTKANNEKQNLWDSNEKLKENLHIIHLVQHLLYNALIELNYEVKEDKTLENSMKEIVKKLKTIEETCNAKHVPHEILKQLNIEEHMAEQIEGNKPNEPWWKKYT